MTDRPPLTPEQLRERQRGYGRAYAERKRRAAGAIPRAEYLATSLERFAPWEKLGMDRRSWYEAGQPLRSTLAPGVPRKGERLRPPAGPKGDTP